MSKMILGIAGSTRSASLNKRLVQAALHHADAGGAVTKFIDLRSLEIPLYDGDLEAESGLPEGVRHLRKAILESAGVLVASPEYNGSFSAVLKNAIDWTTRPDPDHPETPSSAWAGRAIAMLSASPGGLGGVRGLIQLRTVLSGIGALVIPGQINLGKAHEVLNEAGVIEHEKWRNKLATVVDNLVLTAGQIKPS